MRELTPLLASASHSTYKLLVSGTVHECQSCARSANTATTVRYVMILCYKGKQTDQLQCWSSTRSASTARRLMILCYKGKQADLQRQRSQLMSPTAIQIRDESPLGLSIYQAVQLMTEREREREKGVESGGGGAYPTACLSRKLFQNQHSFYHRSVTIALTET